MGYLTHTLDGYRLNRRQRLEDATAKKFGLGGKYCALLVSEHQWAAALHQQPGWLAIEWPPGWHNRAAGKDLPRGCATKDVNGIFGQISQRGVGAIAALRNLRGVVEARQRVLIDAELTEFVEGARRQHIVADRIGP